MSNPRFDAEGFYSALDSVRQARRLTWKQIAAQAGVAASTLTRMGQGKRPDIDGLAALASWSKLDVSSFYRPTETSARNAEPLAEITALLRADKNLSGEGAIALENMLKSAYEHLRRRDIDGDET
ncbi:MAG: XRE family transcriptional regulator [Mesorhizobium sp.]|nr:XRE family transcriptional regulator [Mesorhizobium sp. M7A.F.Ca.MR.362.00.0.0]RWN97475.1 MAG: XRE family transcriptional regulator [Mesorhizobium sp.]